MRCSFLSYRSSPSIRSGAVHGNSTTWIACLFQQPYGRDGLPMPCPALKAPPRAPGWVSGQALRFPEGTVGENREGRREGAVRPCGLLPGCSPADYFWTPERASGAGLSLQPPTLPCSPDSSRPGRTHGIGAGTRPGSLPGIQTETCICLHLNLGAGTLRI